MTNYKKVHGYFDIRNLRIMEIGGKIKYFTLKNRFIYYREKYETKPRRIGAYYSRYFDGMYKEFDMVSYIKNQLRSTPYQIVKDLTR